MLIENHLEKNLGPSGVGGIERLAALPCHDIVDLAAVTVLSFSDSCCNRVNMCYYLAPSVQYFQFFL